MNSSISLIPQEDLHGHQAKFYLFVKRIEQLRAELEKNRGEMRILDIGCGNGTQISLPMAEVGYQVVGVDNHQDSIMHALNQAAGLSARFVCHDVMRLKEIHELHSQRFEVIILADILEHLNYPGALLKEVDSLLSPQGIILISIPNGYGPFEIENYITRLMRLDRLRDGLFFVTRRLRIQGNNAASPPYNEESGHMQFFRRARFEKLLHENGFSCSFLGSGCVVGGMLSSMLLSRVPSIILFNVALARHLPYYLCSSWYFEARPI